ncbi:MAG: ROK family protein [Bacteroidota bacterium]|nr:ROK family protein [Bacteroidota bacterium]
MESIVKTAGTQRILAIDIGGSHVKATLLDEEGQLLTDYEKVDTPSIPTPAKMIAAIEGLARSLSGFDKISAGFPGYVKNNVVFTAPNLGTNYWKGHPFGDELAKALGKPARVVNDADMQGLGIASGKGYEIVVTLGTGFGTAFLNNGRLLPHIELAHHPVSKDRDYDEYIGEKALEKEGQVKWNKRMNKVLSILKIVFNYDHLYLGGGNAQKINFPLGENISLVTNKDGIKGGARLWKQDEKND